MFLGTSDHHLDSKGRVILPTDFREQLGESFYVTMGFNRCIQAMSVDQFDRLRDQIRQLPAAVRTKPGSMETGRFSAGALPSSLMLSPLPASRAPPSPAPGKPPYAIPAGSSAASPRPWPG